MGNLIDWAHSKLLSMWGNVPAWGAVTYQFVFGQMAGITALGAVLAAWLTWLTIKEKLSRQRDIELVREVFSMAEETGNNPLRLWASEMMQRMSTRPGKLR